jgi:Lrp/AsnC family transcriptional regulator, leucine-responsive regulatory protein
MRFFRVLRHYDDTAMELDRFDRQLLNLLQEDASQTAERLAEQIGLSASAIQRRIRRLREQGVIERDVALVDPGKVGRPALFITSLQVESERPEVLARFREWVVVQTPVQQAFYVTGEADFVLVIATTDTEAYDAFMSHLMQQHPNVKRFVTNVTLSVVKRGLAVPIPQV